ncbi:unnamed protein product [Closterium sp. NIES-54]
MALLSTYRTRGERRCSPESGDGAPCSVPGDLFSSGGGGRGGCGSGGSRAGATQHGGSGSGQRQQQQQRRSEIPGSCPYVIRTSDRAGQTCGKFHTQHRCFSRLDDVWRAEFGDEAERPRWADLLMSGVAIFDLDFDAILAAMCALSFSAEGDCYLCVPPDPGIEAAALGASESALPGTAPAGALHTIMLDSGASRCFFRDSTTLTPLYAPVPVRLADPSGGAIVARSSAVFPCPAVLSGSLSGLHLPLFSTNMVSTAALQDAMVTTTTPGGQRVSIRTCTRNGRNLATFTPWPGSSLYTLATKPPQVAASAQVSASGQVAASCLCRLLSHQTLLWHHRLGHPSLPRLRGMHSRLLVYGLPRSLPPLPPSPAPPCLPWVEGRQRAAPYSSLFPPTTAPLQTLHMDVWGPARVSGQSHERYFLLVVDDYTRYTTVFLLRSKGQVVDVLIPWIRTVRLQLRERFGLDLSVLRPHSDRGGEFSSNLLREFCRGEGILKSCMLPNSPQQNGIAERRIGLVMKDVTFDESVPFYHLFPYRSTPPPPPPLFLAPGPPPVAVGSGAARAAASGGAASGGAEPGGAGSEGAGTGGAEPGGAEPRSEGGTGAAEAGGDGVAAGASGAGGAAATCPGGARTRGTRAAGTGGVEVAGGVGPGAGGGGAAGAGVGGTGAADPCAGGAGGTVRPRPYFVPLLQLVLGTPSSTGLTPPLLCPPPDQSQPPLQPASPLPARSPYTEQSGGLTERREPASRPVSPVCTARRAPCSRPPHVPGTHAMTLRPSSVPLHVPLPAPPKSSLPEVPNPESDRARAVSPAVSRLLATTVTDPSFESAAASTLVAEMLDFAAACRLDYATALVAESASASPPSVGGFSQRQGVDYFHTFSPTPKMTTLRVLLHVAAQCDYDLHSLNFSTAFLQGSLYEEIWLRRPPGFTGTFPAGTQWSLCWPVYGLRQAPRQWHDTLRTTLVALGFPPSTMDPSLFLRTDTSLLPFYVLMYVDDLVFATADTEALTLVKLELQKRLTCTDLGELRSYLGLHITRDRARRTITLTQSHMVHQVLQRFGFQFSSPQPTPLSTSHSLSTPPSDESIEPSVDVRLVMENTKLGDAVAAETGLRSVARVPAVEEAEEAEEPEVTEEAPEAEEEEESLTEYGPHLIPITTDGRDFLRVETRGAAIGDTDFKEGEVTQPEDRRQQIIPTPHEGPLELPMTIDTTIEDTGGAYHGATL